jgi:hypothetical protein
MDAFPFAKIDRERKDPSEIDKPVEVLLDGCTLVVQGNQDLFSFNNVNITVS